MRWLILVGSMWMAGCSGDTTTVSPADSGASDADAGETTSADDVTQPDAGNAGDNGFLALPDVPRPAPDTGPPWQPAPPGWQPTTTEPLDFAGTISAAPVPLNATVGDNLTRWTSGRGLVAVEDTLWVVDDHNGAVAFVDRETGLRSTAVAVGALPKMLSVGPDDVGLVSVRGTGEVVRLDPDGVIAKSAVAIEAYGLALNREGATAWVTDAVGRELIEVDATSLSVVSRRPTLERPVGVAVARDGLVYVSHVKHAVLRFEDGVPQGQTIPLRTLLPGEPEYAEAVLADLIGSLPAGMVAAPDSDAMFVAHQRANTGINADCTTYYDFAGCDDVARAPLEGAVTTVGSTGKNAAPVDSWGVDLLLAPADVNHHPTHSLLFVADVAYERVVAYSTARADAQAGPVAVYWTPGGASAIDFSPDGQTAWVRVHRDLSLGRIDLAPLLADGSALVSGTLEATATYADDPRDDVQRMGQRLFEAAGHPLDAQRMACVNCHPDGLDDGRVWRANNGPRQTIALTERVLDTAPYGWTGLSPKLAGYVAGIAFRVNALWDTPQREAIAAHAGQLWMPPRAPVDTEAATRGQEIFDTIGGCTGCHLGGTGVDGATHSIPGQALEINTPSLVGVSHTAPYLHDGSAATLEAVLEATAEWMGGSQGLTAAQRQDLIAYLKTL